MTLYLIALVPEGSIEKNIPRFRCLGNMTKKGMAEKLDVTRQLVFYRKLSIKKTRPGRSSTQLF